MAHDFRRLTDFLVSYGTDKIPHSDTPFLAHLIGVYKDLKEWGCDEHVVLAGLFHSIYGTEQFQGFKLPLTERETVRELIGERAERLAYVNCALVRASIDESAATGTPQLHDRFTDEPLPITDEEWRDLLTMHLCDRLEQVERTGNWDMRRQAWHDMAHRLGGTPLREYERLFAGH
jgi:(p)ppGpp synthase/HD superfamily hydrolase